MKRYYVKIDGQEAPVPYTYEELRSMGVLDFDDIQVRKTLDNNWHSAKYYIFPEEASSSQTVIDEYGQLKNSSQQKNIQIDEFGQIRCVTTSSSCNASGTNTNSSSYSSSSSSDDGVATFFRVIGTIALIALGIVLVASGYGSPLAFACVYGIRQIWKDID